MQKILLFDTISAKSGRIIGSAAYIAAGLVKLGLNSVVFAKISEENREEICGFFTENGVDDEMLFSYEQPRDIDLNGISAVFVTGDFVADEFGFKLVKDLCQKCESLEIPVIFDPGNNGGSKENANETAKNVTVFIPSAEDAEKLCGLTETEKIAEHYLSLGARKIVVTLDKQGAFYKSRVESGTAPTFRADKVVDTTGAGDAFAAGLISGIAEELPLSEAVVRANACGCMAIQHEGLYMPDSDTLREYMLSHRFVVDGCKDY